MRRSSGGGGRRMRSRSRSPIRVVKMAREDKKIVNMLDKEAVQEAHRKPISERISGPNSARITCTIENPGARRGGGLAGRVSGGRFNNFNNQGASGDRFGGRGNINRGDRERDTREQNRDEYLRRRDEDPEKPVMKLVDPTAVPRAARYFGHDDRGREGNEWRGQSLYDPKIDFGRRDYRDRGYGRDRDGGFGRDRDGGFGRDRERGYGRDRDATYGRDRGGGFDRDGGRGDRKDWNGFGGNSSFSSSRADGIWTHDKFIELESDEEVEKVDEDDAGVVVVDSTKSDRIVEE